MRKEQGKNNNNNNPSPPPPEKLPPQRLQPINQKCPPKPPSKYNQDDF